eukprot:jgi/Psemu1/41997/gm1.41997_g
MARGRPIRQNQRNNNVAAAPAAAPANNVPKVPANLGFTATQMEFIRTMMDTNRAPALTQEVQDAIERAESLTPTEVVFREILESFGLNRIITDELFWTGYSSTDSLRDMDNSAIKSLVNGVNKTKHNYCPDPKQVYIGRVFGDRLKLFVAWIEFQPLIGTSATPVDWMSDPEAEAKTWARLKFLKEDDSNTATRDLTLPEPLTPMSKFKEFNGRFCEYLRHKRGVTKKSLLYTIRKDSAVNDTERAGTVGTESTDMYTDWTKYSICCTTHSGSHWTKDNNTLWGILFKLVGADPGWSYIQGLGSEGDGRKAYFTLYSQAYESTNIRLLIEEKRAFPQSSTCSGDTKNYSFDKHKRRWYDAKEFLLRHKAFPPEDQFVTDFCHSISNPRLERAVQLVLNEEGSMYNNFDKAAAHFTQALGIKKIQEKGITNATMKATSNKKSGNKKQKTSGGGSTYNGPLEGKIYPNKVWITMSAAQKNQVRALQPTLNSQGNPAKVSLVEATMVDVTTTNGAAGDQFGSHTHKKKNQGRPVVHIKSFGSPFSHTGWCELDSHADTTAAGSNMVLLDSLDSILTYVDVAPFSDTYSPLTNVPIARCATAWTNPTDGVTYILVFGQALYFGDSLHNSLICPNQVRDCNFNKVEDTPRRYDSTSTHGISLQSNNTYLFIPLQADGVISYFDSCKPTKKELANCEHVLAMDTHTWDPYSSHFAESR